MDASQVLVASGVTVVIPAYNYEKYLGEAVDSALSQDYASNIEVLIIDDGSTDLTGEIALSYGSRVRYHRKINAGLSAARNTGMELAQYDKVLFLDADDVLEPSCVRRSPPPFLWLTLPGARPAPWRWDVAESGRSPSSSAARI